MKASEKYLVNARALLERIGEEQLEPLEGAARALAACLIGGRTLYALGTGHAHMLAEELFYRAGGLARVYPILDERLMLHVSATGSTALERRAGYARELLDRYPLQAGDILLIASNSGRNAVPVEAALEAKSRGLTVLAITNVAQSRQAAPRNAAGKRLFEVADYVLDLMGADGDAAVAVGGQMVAPTSTVAGAALIEALVARTAELALEAGQIVETFTSSNVDGGDAVNEKLVERYRPLVPIL